MLLLSIFVALIFFYSLVSARLERSVLTAPIVFTGAGMLALLALPDLRDRSGGMEVFLRVAEIGLVLLLFTDASRTDRALLRGIRQVPVRLLTTGLLLTIASGTLCALVVFRELSIWEAGILAAILAPTDAGLGQVIVSSPRVPALVRQGLNVEAGLNDGLSVPFLLFFIALAAPPGEEGTARLGSFVVEQLGYGAAIGVAIGLAGGFLLARAQRKGWLAESFQHLGVVMLPLACALASEAAGASMFIAAFVAGLAVQVGFEDAGRHGSELAEEWGQLLNLSVFFLFGLLVARALPQLDLSLALYAVLSLTVVRMLPVALALRGTGLSPATVGFMGWFGPRGLASIVLGLVYLEHATHAPVQPIIPLAVMTTVLLSTLAHGLSAQPGIELYARRCARLGPDAPERKEAPAHAEGGGGALH
jgi:NhaP-type Na+/H+ or K+/H+ antiporter